MGRPTRAGKMWSGKLEPAKPHLTNCRHYVRRCQVSGVQNKLSSLIPVSGVWGHAADITLNYLSFPCFEELRLPQLPLTSLLSPNRVFRSSTSRRKEAQRWQASTFKALPHFWPITAYLSPGHLLRWSEQCLRADVFEQISAMRRAHVRHAMQQNTSEISCV